MTEAASGYPNIASDPGLLADVACLALNRIPPRYIRHRVDLVFYMTDKERAQLDAAVSDAVDAAFQYVEARLQPSSPNGS